MTTTAPVTGRDAARFLDAYARRYHAGAFATPSAADMDQALTSGQWRWWPDGVGALTRRLTRDSTRTDFTGRRYRLAAGARIITHLAATPDAQLPDLDAYDWVFTYLEDHQLTAQLRTQGREIHAVRISASSELIACWGRFGSGYPYDPADRATLTHIPLEISPGQRAAITAEAHAIDNWHDDFPFYSDGSWDAVSLRGFDPADPTWGVKPAEMSKAWWAEHPEAATRYARCDWTTLAERCPATVDLVRGVPWWGELERVRLLRMAGRGGKGGSLARHCDITDRAAGTADGQIVRFHIPLITHPDITMSAWNLRGKRTDQHLPAWTLWYLDARKPHAVDNRAGIDRVHLVVDVKADHTARQAIAAGEDAAA